MDLYGGSDKSSHPLFYALAGVDPNAKNMPLNTAVCSHCLNPLFEATAMNETTPTRPTVLRGAQAALSLIALAGIGVTIVAMLGETDRRILQSLAMQRAVVLSSGLLYMLAATIVHLKTFLELQRGQLTSRLGTQLLLCGHGGVAVAVFYCIALRRLASHALVVGLDPLLSSVAILSTLSAVVALAMLMQYRLLKSRRTRYGLWRSMLFAGVCMLLTSSLLWLEFSPLD